MGLFPVRLEAVAVVKVAVVIAAVYIAVVAQEGSTFFGAPAS